MVITGAAGPLGSIVGRIAKVKVCKVIEIAGSYKKGEQLRQWGIDEFINYKESNLDESLKNLAPTNSTNCYSDNVSSTIIECALFSIYQIFGWR